MDSGWEILAGDETQDELDRADSIVLWQLGWLVERCPILLQLVRSGPSAGEWLWSAERQTYQRLE